ncbi:thylakoid membrane photosystem I accumulation factor [Desertifilum sp. FACHB-1129]|uniref:Thioredoxin n=2 Tax=Desertifilum tharense IPPAS B-1220 TaxID=1781255 RepID=A0A1E5QLG6_9CYAN|nr:MULTISPECIES: thylakoid membrane photosystem I accumulation factor [Desertifilum]MDA0209716.1 thylakoid membrane photosystem I accumulation factor [Cyanobacteria bacterium FC1]MBD2310793.1 thylakoid membrane photosystem I accumulation factor [Desertifilum sp. FACHB-1129]MBD2320830.1 thylakoid membrane photosystem I accumulation factor [Desertifilum sp. FACHB-866]MBD2330958.1 thylakoid membrane photosystem I accumulation factor [Desertifilum sp. FACHB-868]OEJ75203.1 thioredoxin [Desertifilum
MNLSFNPLFGLRSLRILVLLVAIALISWLQLLGTPPALAGLNDDRFDGNIFALYGGNGGLVPARLTLPEAFKREQPILLVYYLDDSRDCKQFAIVVSQLQAFYGRAAIFIPVNVDTLSLTKTNDPSNPDYYYDGVVPQTLVLNSQREVVFNHKGQVAFEKVDDVMREVFNLLPRNESVELKPRPLNEINTELAPN